MEEQVTLEAVETETNNDPQTETKKGVGMVRLLLLWTVAVLSISAVTALIVGTSLGMKLDRQTLSRAWSFTKDQVIPPSPLERALRELGGGWKVALVRHRENHYRTHHGRVVRRSGLSQIVVKLYKDDGRKATVRFIGRKGIWVVQDMYLYYPRILPTSRPTSARSGK